MFSDHRADRPPLDSVSKGSQPHELKIGVVEDSPMMVSYWHQCLRNSDAQLILTTSKEKELRRLLDQAPHLIFCPGVPDHMDGITLGREIKSHRKCGESLIFIHTTLSDCGLFKRWDSRIIAGLLAKPFTGRQLTELLERVRADMKRQKRKRPSVVIVSSENKNRAPYERALAERGYEITQVAPSDSVYRDIIQSAPDIFVIDLPGQNDLSLYYCHQLAVSPHTFMTPVILATDNNAGIVSSKAFDNGVIDIFSEDDDGDKFSSILKNVSANPVGDHDRTVIILDEDPVQCSIMGKLLTRCGHTFHICRSIGELEAFLALIVPDMILVSTRLPDGNCVDLCQRLSEREQLEETAIVITATEDLRRTVADCLEQGAADFLIRPFSGLEFSTRIENLIRLKSLKNEVTQKHKILDGLTFVDDLTGLMNRNYLKIGLEKEIERARKRESKLSVLRIEFDNLLHQACALQNRRIKKIASVIRDTLRPGDFLCRANESELTVLLPSTTEKTAAIVAERIRATCESGFTAGRQPGHTLSIGLSTFPEPSRSDSLLYDAGSALYLSKKNGGNQVTPFSKA